MNTHKFDVEDAKKYGVEKAILLEHLRFHQQSNEGNDDLTFNGKPHAFIKKETIEKMYPYLKYNSVRKWLKELEDDGVLESCKPKAKSGYHLKYYHIFPNDISGQSNDTGDQSKNDISDHSSILPCEEPSVHKRGFITSVKESETRKQLISIWYDYRKKKGRHPTPYEREVMEHEMKSKSISHIKESILYTVKNGWLSLQEPESNSTEKEFDPSKSAYFS